MKKDLNKTVALRTYSSGFMERLAPQDLSAAMSEIQTSWGPDGAPYLEDEYAVEKYM